MRPLEPLWLADGEVRESVERLSVDRWEDGAGAGMVGTAAGKRGWRKATAAAMMLGRRIGSFWVALQLTACFAHAISWNWVGCRKRSSGGIRLFGVVQCRRDCAVVCRQADGRGCRLSMTMRALTKLGPSLAVIVLIAKAAEAEALG